MFPDSELAATFSCGKDKTSYLVKFGIAPFIKQQLISEVSKDSFVVMFDESLNRSTNNKQMDLHLRYWAGDRVQSRYFGSQFLGHATAQDLLHNFMSLLRFVKKELLDVSAVKLARLDATDVQTWVPPKDVDIGIDCKTFESYISLSTAGYLKTCESGLVKCDNFIIYMYCRYVNVAL
ncbi:hypothetical protein QQF64_017375 [Cirrhinus molitorella]|uniref:Uncharacterized protein n=1 Tax=Cirrhinus molitorella TaxID=172907 RepID=A0ABR3LIH3_9TELE